MGQRGHDGAQCLTGHPAGDNPCMGTSRLRSIAIWAAVSLLMGLMALVVAVRHFDALPDPYPTHFGLSGAADSFSDKSWGTVLLPVIVGQASALVVLSIAAAAPQGSRAVRQPLAAMGAGIGGGTSVLAVAQYLSDDAVPPPWIFWAFLVLLLISLGWLLVAVARTSRELGEDEAQHWKWGLVYVNPDNPDAFVPKRIGTGVSLNLGRPLGWIVLALILLPSIALTVGIVSLS